jgi:hypothetical protein
MAFWIIDAEDETKCLAADGNTITNGSGLTVTTLRTSTDAQKWTIQPNTGGFTMVNIKDINFALNRVINGTITMYNRKTGTASNLRWNFDFASGTSINTAQSDYDIYNIDSILTVNGCSDKELQIYDVFGKLIFSEQISSDNYSTRLNFTHGIYVVKAGNKTKKIIL